MALLDVHGLRQSDVRPNGGAHEVEDPESGKNTSIEFADPASTLHVDNIEDVMTYS